MKMWIFLENPPSNNDACYPMEQLYLSFLLLLLLERFINFPLKKKRSRTQNQNEILIKIATFHFCIFRHFYFA